jgi:hypothetical protein
MTYLPTSETVNEGVPPSAMTTEGEILRERHFRSELANDTICSLICAKQNQNMECYEYCPDSEILKKAACIDYNNELKK